MRLATTLRLPQPPSAAFEMLTDPRFLDAAAASTEPLESTSEVKELVTSTRRVMAAHPSITRLTGPTLTVIDQVEWQPEWNGEVRAGVTSVEVEGLPVRLEGTIQLGPDGTGSRLDYLGNLTIAIPLLGRSLEQQAAPLLLEALERQESVAAGWQQP